MNWQLHVDDYGFPPLTLITDDGCDFNEGGEKEKLIPEVLKDTMRRKYVLKKGLT